MSGRPYDVAVIGGGIVGLATARQLLADRPGARLIVLERETSLASHQSAHNSGVLHAGLYYAPGSLKARLCRAGKAELEAYAERMGIPYTLTGKLVVAVHPGELDRFESLRARAEANGVPGLEVMGPERMREIEPNVAGIRGLWSPSTGVIDFRRVALSYGDDILSAGGEIRTAWPVTGIETRRGELVLRSGRDDEVQTRHLVACAGLWADRVAAMTAAGRISAEASRIIPFRGDYYSLTPDARPLVRGLIYPVPDPLFPFLGVHFTRRQDGEVWAGPNAVLAFKRTGYRRRDLSIRDLAATLTYPGFLRLAAKYWRVGLAEMWRDVSKGAFLSEMQRYVPALRADQVTFGPSGVRAQALSRDGTLVDDFVFAGTGRVLHVRNAPSPAATASLAIARVLADRALDRFAM